MNNTIAFDICGITPPDCNFNAVISALEFEPCFDQAYQRWGEIVADSNVVPNGCFRKEKIWYQLQLKVGYWEEMNKAIVAIRNGNLALVVWDIIGSGNALLHGQRQAITGNDDLLLLWPWNICQ